MSSNESFAEEYKRTHPKLAKRSEMSPLAAHKLGCAICVGGSRSEVENCTAQKTCPSYPFRFGTRPKVSSASDKPKRKMPEGAREALNKYREEKKAKKEESDNKPAEPIIRKPPIRKGPKKNG